MDSGDRVVLAFDVGATNTRVVGALLTPDGLAPHPALGEGASETISSREGLYDFVSRVIGSLDGRGRVSGAVLAAAGPVRDHSSVSMTNWMDADPVCLRELEDAGLPEGATELMNDLEAGAHGLMDLLRRKGSRADGIETIHRPDEIRPRGHIVFVAPGTGLGAAGIVLPGPGHDGHGEIEAGAMSSAAMHVVVPCEVQHTRLPPVDDAVARVAARIASDARRDWVSWEDVVSGRGLLDTYVSLCALSGLVPIASAMPPDTDEETAHVAAIAEAALRGEDAVCIEALDIYYRCLGAFCQALALTMLPCAGVFVGGDTTRKNRDFLVRSGFVPTFLRNPAQGRLLDGTPVRLVLAETNLAGGLRRAEEMARSASRG